MDFSPLYSLPAELRVSIFEHVLYHDRVIIRMRTVPGSLCMSTPAGSTHILAVTETCKQFRKESESILYSINEFILVAPSPGFQRLYSPDESRSSIAFHWVLALQKWLHQIGETNAYRIANITLQLGLWPSEDFKLPRWHEKSRSPILLIAMSLGALARFFQNTGTTCNAKLQVPLRVATDGEKEWEYVPILVPVSGGNVEERIASEIQRFSTEINDHMNNAIANNRVHPRYRRRAIAYDRAHVEFQSAVRMERDCAPDIFGTDVNFILVPERQGQWQRELISNPIR